MNKTLWPLLLFIGVLLMPVNLLASPSGKTLSLAVGKAETLTLTEDMADVLVADPSIVDVGALKSNQLYAVGLKTGATNILVFDKDGQQIMTYTINVAVDHANLQGTLASLIPGQNIKVTSVNNDIVLSGDVANPMMASRATDIAKRFTSGNEGIVNLMSVQAEQQVTLKVKIIEASKATLKELGLESNFTANSSLGDLAGSSFTTNAATGLTKNPLGIGSVIFDTAGLGRLNLILRALEDNDMVNTLAEPNLTAISGETAGFLVGGEIPIPASRDQNGNVVVDYKKFGVSLNFKPIVLSEDRISLNMDTEVSAPSNTNAVTLNAITVPSLNVRRAQTTVELNSGGSLMIAGLLQSKTVGSMNQIPGIKETPILGDLLKSQSFNRDESELLVLVTAYLVKPYADKEETKRADTTTDQDVTVEPAMTADLQKKLRMKFGTKYDRALTAVPEGASYVFD